MVRGIVAIGMSYYISSADLSLLERMILLKFMFNDDLGFKDLLQLLVTGSFPGSSSCWQGTITLGNYIS